MSFGLNEVMDLKVFDKKDNLVVNLNAGRESLVQYLGEDDKGFGYIGIKNALLNTDYLKFISDSGDVSDYEKELNGGRDVIEVGGSGNKDCKIIATSLARDYETQKDSTYIIEAPNAEVVNQLNLETSIAEVSSFDILFKVNPYNEKGSLFKIHLKAQ